jgi:hypothetical protein
MKFFIEKNKDPELVALYCEIVDFLWDAGNTVYDGQHYGTNVKQVIEHCDCIVIIDNQVESFQSAIAPFQASLNMENSTHGLYYLVFLKHGVCSNYIPFPHEIFHYNSLSTGELKRFYDWCRQLNLFQNNKN